jgi:hypothetical protein
MLGLLSRFSTLALLVTGVGADHTHDAIAPDDLAVAADFLHRSQYFHFILLAALSRLLAATPDTPAHLIPDL